MASRQPRSEQPPVVVIVGETGSGKSALAIELAQKFSGEIIAADSRTVYTGMDIGTAKPTSLERRAIPHYGIDVVEPSQRFSAYDFQQLAREAVSDIASRHKLPIIVGGTGLYIDAYIYGFAFRPRPDDAMRHELADLPVSVLQQRVIALGLPLPSNASNPRHLARLLESGSPPEQVRQLRPNTLLIGLRLPRDELRVRIAKRVDAMFTAGLVEEVSTLIKTYGDVEALRAPGYIAVAAYIRGEISQEEAKQQFVRADLLLAKRQRTWFKRNPYIHWLEGNSTTITQQTNKLVTQFLAS